MLFAPPLEIINLLESVYDKDGNFVEEKLSNQTTPEQRELFMRYREVCKNQLERYNKQFEIKRS